MIYLVLGISLIFSVLLLNLINEFKLTSPLNISCVVWLGVFLSGFFFYDYFFEIKGFVFGYWCTWFLTTSCVYILVDFVARKRKIKISYFREINYRYEFILLIFFIYLLYRIYVVGTGGSQQFFLNLRLSDNGVEGFEKIGFISYLYPLIFAFFVFENIYKSKNNIGKRIFLWIFMFAYAVSSMGKFGVITPIVAWLVIQEFQGKKISYLFLKIFPFCFMGMIFLHFIRSSEDSVFNIWELLAVYIYSPFVALGYVDLHPSITFGENWFRFFYAVSHALAIGPEPLPVILEYVEIPVLTNVYTVIYPFAKDFGYIGVFLSALVFSGFFSFFYSMAKIRYGFYLMIYSVLLVVLFAQFIGDLFWYNFSQHLQEIIAIFFVYFSSRKVNNVR